jgi:hypothetical protein
MVGKNPRLPRFESRDGFQERERERKYVCMYVALDHRISKSNNLEVPRSVLKFLD